jgi:hypothetical protein
MGYAVYTPSVEEEKFFEDLIRQQQAGQVGFGYGFVGMPYQRGAGLGSIFASLFRAIAPMAKSAAKAVGRKALNAGLGVAADALAGQNVKDSFKTHATAMGQDLVTDAQSALKRRMTGSGRGRGRGRGRGGKRARKATVFDL